MSPPLKTASTRNPGNAVTAQVAQAWGRLAPRERRLVIVAGWLVGAALLWWVALAPALTTLGQAPLRHSQLDGQLQHMQALAAQATQLKNVPPVSRDESLRALETATSRHLGATATLSVLGDQATVTLKGAAAEALALWLADVRINGRATPSDVRLNRGTQGSTPDIPVAARAQTASAPAQGLWSGTLTLALAR